MKVLRWVGAWVYQRAAWTVELKVDLKAVWRVGSKAAW
jgi:hypothetical protein